VRLAIPGRRCPISSIIFLALSGGRSRPNDGRPAAQPDLLCGRSPVRRSRGSQSLPTCRTRSFAAPRKGILYWEGKPVQRRHLLLTRGPKGLGRTPGTNCHHGTTRLVCPGLPDVPRLGVPRGLANAYVSHGANGRQRGSIGREPVRSQGRSLTGHHPITPSITALAAETGCLLLRLVNPEIIQRNQWKLPGRLAAVRLCFLSPSRKRAV
jgi:hypothetical protein